MVVWCRRCWVGLPMRPAEPFVTGRSAVEPEVFEVVFKSMASHPFEISTDRGRTAVERSLAEIRAGRPVLVHGQGEAVLVASAESLEPELCQRLRAPAFRRPRPRVPAPPPPPPR